ncbi:MAG: hypothetical protein ACI915_003845, partial [Gammaproteobacteria bacterium]
FACNAGSEKSRPRTTVIGMNYGAEGSKAIDDHCA